MFQIFLMYLSLMAMQGIEAADLTPTRSSVFSRDEKMINGVMTKQSRSKYSPHFGAKEARKYAGRGSLGFNASRAFAATP